jgi:hypothetical protein
MNLYQRINAVRAQVREVQKNKVHQHHKYAFAGHDSVTASVRNAMVEHGIDQSVSVIERESLPDGRTCVQVQVIWINVDKPEERKEVISFGEGPPLDKNGQGAPQHIGSAISYAVKFALLKNFMLVGDDTPDIETYSDTGGYTPAPQQKMMPDDHIVQLHDELACADSPAALEKIAERISARRYQIPEAELNKLEQLYFERGDELAAQSKE